MVSTSETPDISQFVMSISYRSNNRYPQALSRVLQNDLVTKLNLWPKPVSVTHSCKIHRLSRHGKHGCRDVNWQSKGKWCLTTSVRGARVSSAATGRVKRSNLCRLSFNLSFEGNAIPRKPEIPWFRHAPAPTPKLTAHCAISAALVQFAPIPSPKPWVASVIDSKILTSLESTPSKAIHQRYCAKTNLWNSEFVRHQAISARNTTSRVISLALNCTS